MPKILLRIISLFLVPCLLGDPTLAAVIQNNPFVPTHIGFSKTAAAESFETQALEAELVASEEHAIDGKLSAKLHRITAAQGSVRNLDPQGRSKPRILIADDDNMIRKILQRILEALGYDVVAIENGQRALDLFKIELFDLLITDNQMPVLTGPELIRAIRAIDPKFPIILHTGEFNMDKLARQLNVELLAKPIQRQQLLDTVQSLLDKRSAKIAQDRIADLESNVLEALTKGPLTGKELMRMFPSISADSLWQAVLNSKSIQTTFAGVHYPRIVVGKGSPPVANLSPSPLREFYSYTVIAKTGDPRITEKVEALNQQRKNLSAQRLRQARMIVYELAHQFADLKLAILLSGDVAQEMAHSEKRRNGFSGETMEGSDFDFIIITQDRATAYDIEKIQNAFMWATDIMVAQNIAPVEVDCDVFRLSQMAMLSPHKAIDLMHAKNILQSEFVFGDTQLVSEARAALKESLVVDKIEELRVDAQQARAARKGHLLSTNVKNWSLDDAEFFLGTFESFVETGLLTHDEAEQKSNEAANTVLGTSSSEYWIRNRAGQGLEEVLTPPSGWLDERNWKLSPEEKQLVKPLLEPGEASIERLATWIKEVGPITFITLPKELLAIDVSRDLVTEFLDYLTQSEREWVMGQFWMNQLSSIELLRMRIQDEEMAEYRGLFQQFLKDQIRSKILMYAIAQRWKSSSAATEAIRRAA